MHAPPPPFTTFTITSKVAVYAPAEWADTLTLFHLYQYTICTLLVSQFGSRRFKTIATKKQKIRNSFEELGHFHNEDRRFLLESKGPGNDFLGINN